MEADTERGLDQKLVRALRRYEALAADPATFLWVMDPALVPTGANAAWEAYTGQSRTDYLTQGWLDAIAERDRERCLRQIAAHVPLGRPFSLELGIRRHDGQLRRHLVRAIPVRDGHGVITEWMGTASDVEGDRMLIEDALAEHRELRERLVALTDGAEAVLTAATLQGVRAAVCDLAARVLPADGYALWALDPARPVWRVVYSRALSERFVAQELPGAEVPFSEPLVADRLDEEVIAHRAAAYREEGIRSLVSVPLPIDGARRATLVVYYREPHTTSPAELQVAIALGQLTAAALGNAGARERQEQMRAETERHSTRMAFLAEASTLLGSLDYEASFRRLAELAVPSLGDWCAIDVEREGQLVRVAIAHRDPGMIETARELHARYPADMDAPTGAPNVLRTGQSEIYPEVSDAMIAASARDPAHLASLRALAIRSVLLAPLTARGRTLGVLTLVSSAPGRQYGPGDLAFVEEVARRAAIALDNARLYEEAQRGNRAKDEFLALLSHELRTPLNAIMGWAQLLTDTERDDAARGRGLQVIQRNARLQAELVDGLLDVTRVATGGLPLERETIEVGEAAAASVEAMRPLAEDRGVTVQLTVADRCRVSADPNRLQQIFSNLLSNALKFSEKGGRIDVRVARTPRWADVAFIDTGAGIPPEFLPHVFERFRQGDSSTTRRHGGLGLGLWLVRELVRAHGGTVTAASEGLGRGSTFTLRLPEV